MKKKEVPLTPKELLALLAASAQRETWLRYENSLLRDRLLRWEDDNIVRRLVYEEGPDESRGKLVLLDDERVVYMAPDLTPSLAR
jgi:hypothetical protein